MNILIRLAALAAAILAIGAVRGVSHDPLHHQRKKNAGRTDDATSRQTDQKSLGYVVGLVDAYIKQKVASDTKQTRQNRATNILAALSLFVLFIYTGATGTYTVFTSNILEETRKANEAQERPWVKVDDVAITRIRIDDQGSTVYARINGMNVGHSPAERVTLQTRLVLPEIDLPDPRSLDPASVMLKVCEQGMRNHLNGGAGPQVVIFPGSTKQLGPADSDAIDTLEADEIATARDHFAHRVGLAEVRTWPYRSPLILVGCVTYSSSVGSKPHQTSFTFNVWQRPTGGTPGSDESFELTKLGTIPSDQIHAFEARWADIVN